ncbi:DNA repair protein RadA [hydrothermal vent metagenome]|uniref:DNA repair protein RadA n=1 Tax=hydrothermal vent metagenome TaxID=652676 RepID=A0A3B1CS26_9ZZZZ
MAKTSTIYVCQNCGYQSAKWLGKCPSCNKWDTMSEERPLSSGLKGRRQWSPNDGKDELVSITDVTSGNNDCVPTGINELDRALGGGIVAGSLVLAGGDPGVGKSTLLLQMAGAMASLAPVLYVSGEESPNQIKMRGQRLGCMRGNLLILPETQIEEIERQIDKVRPSLVVIDSIQTVYTEEIPSAPGTVGQVRESAGRMLLIAKKKGIPVFLIGHVTKDGAIAGPRLLEHMVDTVLYFEGERGSPFRILRAVKNRFGSTNEIGVFEMKPEGMMEVTNPSELFLSDKPGGVSGSVVVALMNGTRPLLVEIQALVTSSNYPNPRRVTQGVDQNRVAILMAIIEKRAGMSIMGEDVFVNAVGGVRVDEPACDLGMMTAIVSSFRDAVIDSHTVVIGEVGLGGEVRGAPQTEIRVMEARSLGFKRAVIPKSKVSIRVKGIEIIEVENVSQALEILFDS